MGNRDQEKRNDGASPERRLVGYVLVDPNTHAMDWDGTIHETEADAVKELAEGVHGDYAKNPFDYSDIDGCCLAYVVCEVTERRDLDERAVTQINEARCAAMREFQDGA